MPGGRIWSCSALAAVAVVLNPWEAAAQVVAPPVVNPGERVQDVDLIADIIYSSNVAGGDAAVARARGIKPADVIFEPHLRFDIARPIGRETVYILGNAGYDFYERNSVLNRENIDITPGVLAQIGRCQGGVSGEYSRAQRDLSELAVVPGSQPARVDQRDTLQVEEVGGNAACVRSTGIGPSVSASETWSQNSAGIERFTDAQTFSGSAGLTYQRPVLGSIRLFGAYSHTDYPGRTALLNVAGVSPATGYRTVSGGLTYTRAVGSRLQGSLSVSYTDLASSGLSGPGFTGLTYSAALTYLASSRLTTNILVSRATVPSNRLNSTYAIDESYSAQAKYDLSSRLTFESGASYLKDDYMGVAGPAAAFDLTKQNIYTLFGDASLKLNRRISFVLDARQLWRTANFVGFSYSETRVGLTARATF